MAAAPITQAGLQGVITPVLQAISAIGNTMAAQTALLTEAAGRDEAEQARKLQAAAAKFRELNKEELAGVDMLIKIKQTPALSNGSKFNKRKKVTLF